MRVVTITRTGGPEVLQVQERPSPVAGRFTRSCTAPSIEPSAPWSYVIRSRWVAGGRPWNTKRPRASAIATPGTPITTTFAPAAAERTPDADSNTTLPLSVQREEDSAATSCRVSSSSP